MFASKRREILQIRLVMGVRRGQFPSESERAPVRPRPRAGQGGAAPGVRRGISTGVATVPDPADPARTLDTFFEVVFAKDVEGVEGLAEPLRYALGLAKTAEARR